jgi:hypothetical protein
MAIDTNIFTGFACVSIDPLPVAYVKYCGDFLRQANFPIVYRAESFVDLS